jgi:hypothetical protein
MRLYFIFGHGRPQRLTGRAEHSAKCDPKNPGGEKKCPTGVVIERRRNMAQPQNDADELPNGIVPRPATFPLRRPEGTVHVAVPVDWPQSIRHGGKTFYLTGKLGHHARHKTQAAEYEAVDGHGHRTGERVWLLADGTVTED